MSKEIYLDHNATTPIDARVLAQMLPFLEENFGNPSSIHRWGRPVKAALRIARQQAAGLINASAEEIYFTSGGTESDSWALQAVAGGKSGKRIITCQIEHPAILKTCAYLEEQGVRLTYLPVDKFGRISLEGLEAAITDDTVLISIMFGNNEVGTIQPVAEIGAIAKKRGVLFHCDAVQAAGKVPIDVENLNVDLLSLSAHKMYGPKGCGALYVKSGTPFRPLIFGGGQEQGLRSGTENTASVIGFGKACQIAQEELLDRKSHLEGLAGYLLDSVQTQICGINLNSHPQTRLPGTLNLSISGVDSESLLLNLDLEKIAVSSGAACKAGAHKTSYILEAMGVEKEFLNSAIRISLGKDNTKEEIDYFVAVLKSIVKRLRGGMSCR